MLNTTLNPEKRRKYQMLCKLLEPRSDYKSNEIGAEYKGKTQQDSSSKK
jgi:hypothetical protein